jgi:hypothetical protein
MTAQQNGAGAPDGFAERHGEERGGARRLQYRNDRRAEKFETNERRAARVIKEPDDAPEQPDG